MNGDPAIEAAGRIDRAHAFCVNDRHTPSCLTDSAREALKPLRDLHRPFDRPISWGNTQTERVCNHCLGPVAWPCATALHIYSAEELS